MKSTTIAIDLAKTVFQIAVSNEPGRVSENHRLSRAKFLDFCAQLQPATVLMEACGSAHHWGRRLQQLGHTVHLLPPHQVRPYVQRNKTDCTDTKGLLEAFRNEDLHEVPVKSVAQQTMTALHRLRSGWMGNRTARINAVRGLLRELGYTIPVGARHVVPRAWELLEDAEADIPDPLRYALAEACLEIRELEQRTQAAEQQLRQLAREHPAVQRLQTIPGIGLLTATALVAFIGDVQRFPSGRHFASYLGLTPREHSSGAVRRLGGISKRGDVYLRTLLVHGARAVLRAAKKKAEPDRLHAWAVKLHQARGHNKAAVALANKMARIAWAVWRQEKDYQPAI